MAGILPLPEKVARRGIRARQVAPGRRQLAENAVVRLGRTAARSRRAQCRFQLSRSEAFPVPNS